MNVLDVNVLSDREFCFVTYEVVHGLTLFATAVDGDVRHSISLDKEEGHWNAWVSKLRTEQEAKGVARTRACV